MNVEEIRQLFKGNIVSKVYEPEEGDKFGLGYFDFYDPFYTVLNVAWATLGGNDVPKDVKVGDYTVRLVQVKLTPGEKELSAWNTYKDAECTAVFEVVETGDRFIVSGDNGSWGWGALMETDLSAIYLLNPDEVEIDKQIERSILAEEFAGLAKQLAEAKDRVIRLETEIIELKRKKFN